MAQRIITLILLLGNLILFPVSLAQASFLSSPVQRQFIPAEQAFNFDFKQSNNVVSLHWAIQPGYYLYRQQIKITAKNAQLGTFTLPEGVEHRDDFYGTVAIYPDSLTINIPLLDVAQSATLEVVYQGCAEAGFCYPPETRIVPITPLTLANVENAQETHASLSNTSTLNTESEKTSPFSPLWALLIGIGIAFTPCVLPMYPMISAIILGREQAHSSKRTLLLAFSYVQGMALTYTLLGVVIAAAGLQFQAMFQHPAVLIGISALFILLALSMFGCYSLQLPSGLQTRLTLWSNRQREGSLPGCFVMGALAGLICSPCTTAPLSAILLYIAQSGNLMTGAGTLYLYALGMGLPLIAITLFGNRLLPRSGPWMQHVKEAFGFIILALPIFLLERIIGDVWGLRLWSALGCAFLSWAFLLSLRFNTAYHKLLQIILLCMTILASYPLQQWAWSTSSTQATSHQTLNFIPVNNTTELSAELKKSPNNWVMLDFYADWCVACKEFEKYTFADPQVQNALRNITLLQANVTANTPEQRQLMKEQQVLGLPTIIFFNPERKEVKALRVTGFMAPSEFLQHLQNMQLENGGK